MVAVDPAPVPDIPHTRPVEEPALATAGLLLLHVPPADASDNGLQTPTHILNCPAIGAGSAFTVTMAVAWQLVATL